MSYVRIHRPYPAWTAITQRTQARFTVLPNGFHVLSCPVSIYLAGFAKYLARSAAQIERRLQVLEHREMTNIQRRQLIALHIGSRGYQIVAKANVVMTPPILSHQVAAALGFDQ